MSNYVTRLEAPAAYNMYYNRSSKNGVNECLEIKDGSCLPNCVGYAWGRRYEITGKRPKLSKANAEDWYNYNDGYKRSTTPAPGAVVCWSKGRTGDGSDGCGHVAIVELVCSNGDIVTSESAYGGERWRLRVYTKSSGYSMGAAYKFQGFILLDEATENNKKGDDIDEVAYQVIRGEWGNGKERKERLTEAGYDYETVRKRVNELM